MQCSEMASSVPVRGARLPATLHRPSGIQEPPVVVMIHGFTGNRIENSRLFVEISRSLCAAGVASLRFDLRGHGEGPGGFEDFDIEQAIRDAEEVVRWVLRHPSFKTSALGLLGLSMGGYIAIEVASRKPRELRALALLSPAIDFTELRERHRGGVVVEGGYAYLGPQRMKLENLEKLLSRSAMGRARSIDVPTLIVHAVDDDVVPSEQSRRFFQGLRTRDKKLVLLEEGGHVFTTYSSRRRVIEEVTAWFREKLAVKG
mgnify:CR=1 FL=1